MNNLSRLIIGVDVGGTNTDAVLLDGERIIAKSKKRKQLPTSHKVLWMPLAPCLKIVWS